jgi:hypothetical protein
MKYLNSLAFCILFFFTACNSNSQSANQMAINPTVASQKVSSSCLSKFVEKACDLVSVEQIASIAGVQSSDIKQDVLDHTPSSGKRITLCKFKWESGRTMKMANVSMEIPMSDELMVGSLETPTKDELKGSYLEWFDNRYRTMTDEEMASFKKGLEKRLKDEDEAVKEAGRGLSDFPKGFQYERIENLGDRAAAENIGKLPDVTLYVLDKDTKFEVRVSASSDKEVNLEIAIQVARLVLAHCD